MVSSYRIVEEEKLIYVQIDLPPLKDPTKYHTSAIHIINTFNLLEISPFQGRQIKFISLPSH